MNNPPKFEQKPEYHKAIEEAWPLVEKVRAIAEKYGISRLEVSGCSVYPETSGVHASDWTLGDTTGAFYEKKVCYDSINYVEYENEKME